jgi:ribosome-associated protein
MAKSDKKPRSARQLAVEAARIAHDRHCDEIVVLNLSGISPVTDFFVIATGTSDIQMRAVAEEIVQHAREMGHRPLHAAGFDSTVWILLDFVDVVVHIFDAEHRHYYDLELIWGDAPRVRWRRRTRLPGAAGDSDDERSG